MTVRTGQPSNTYHGKSTVTFERRKYKNMASFLFLTQDFTEPPNIHSFYSNFENKMSNQSNGDTEDNFFK